MNETPQLKLPYIMPSQAQKHVTHNEALRMLDALVQLSVTGRDLASPPSDPAEGDRYLVASPATGVWSGQENAVAAFHDGAWSFYRPQTGWIAWIIDEATAVYWSGEVWMPFSDSIGALQNIALFGIGTTADATNPFSAKLNKALWTAKYTSEAGDGDLRYTLNKEAAGNTFSLLMQTAWSGRAEVGLVGDDDLVFKVSADGISWMEALRLANDDGAASFGARLSVEIEPGASTEPALSIDVPTDVAMFQGTRYSDNTQGPVYFGRKARGSKAAPEPAQAGDTLLGFRGYGHTGERFVSGLAGAAFLLESAEDYVDGSNYGTQIRFFTTQNGTTVNSERLRIADTGDLQMGGANTVVTSTRHPVLRSYTVATLPVASPEGQLIYVADGSGGKRLAISDGADWRFADGTMVS